MKAAAPERSGWRPSWLAFALVLATGLAYLPALRAGYVWDDDKYLTENPLLTDAQDLLRIWVPGNTPQYYPAVFTSFWIEHRLWGLAPFGYHAVNVALHVLAALLVWRLARRLCIPGAGFLGALFALHPVHVESVAWVTERKNVLSGVFYLLAVLAYLRFQDTEESEHEPPPARSRWRWYAASFALFVLALLSKTVTCSLPAALILLMLWRRERLTLRRLLPLAPMFAVGFGMALLTAHLERTQVGAAGPEFAFGLAQRLEIAGKALVFYPWKLLVPWPLVFVYPRWELAAPSPAAYWPWIALGIVVITTIALYRRGVRGPFLALAFYAGTIVPALGFFDVYPMRYSFVADHFQYLASLGVMALVVAGVVTRLSSRRARNLLGASVLLACALLAWNQSTAYADAETLWRRTLRDNPQAWMAQSNLARLLSDRGEHAEALEFLQAALAQSPSPRATDQIRLNLALTLGKLGRHDEALALYRELQDSSGGMQLRLAQTLERLGRDDEAEEHYRAALAGEESASARVPFAVHLLRRGRPAEALEWLERHLAEHAQDVDARMFLADAQAGAGRIDEAVRSAERAQEVARAHGDARTGELIALRLEQFRRSQGSAASSETRRPETREGPR